MSNRLTSSRWGVAAVIAASLALSGCFGGSDDDEAVPSATSQVPDSASASSGGFIAYLQMLVASAADMLEPVDTSAVTAPTDDTGEPVALN